MKIKESGITLIALVVTIVVLLILAGVSISMLTGENGIITQAQQASIKNENGTVLEALRLKLSQYLSENEGKYAKDKLELLRDDNIIDESNVVNVLELVEQKLDTGNGNNNKDVYVIEENHLYYYDKKGNKTDLGDLGNIGETIEETDPDLFVVSDDGTINLKYYDDYYNNRKQWEIENVVIPREIDGKIVKKTGTTLFNGSEGNGRRFDNIKTILIPDTVIEIGDYSFSVCTGLTNMTIPDSVTSIGESAFDACSALTNITIPDSVKTIGDSAFADCSSLTNITIPDSIISIGGYTFFRCNSLTNITIPDSVTSIGEYTFYECGSLTSITIPDSVISIGERAFYDCSALTNITISDSVTSIGELTFYDCSALTNITIPDSVTSIGKSAFYDCSGLTNIAIPDSVTSIGDYTFYGCNSLTSITIPKSVTTIGDDAFKGCSGLININVNANNQYYDSRNNCNAIIEKRTNELLLGCKNTIIPENVKSIGTNAFDGCSGLTNITIPESVKSIGYGAFRGCSDLTNITIPESVTSIGAYAFSSCDNLKKVYYKGTEQQWNQITIGVVNQDLINAEIKFNQI